MPNVDKKQPIGGDKLELFGFDVFLMNIVVSNKSHLSIDSYHVSSQPISIRLVLPNLNGTNLSVGDVAIKRMICEGSGVEHDFTALDHHD